MKARTGLKIGITIAACQDTQSLLGANGLSQNVLYLALLFQRMPIAAQVGLICNTRPHAVADAYGLPVWTVEEAIGHCDLVIEMGSRSFDVSHVERLRKRRGKIVSFVAGNVMAFNLESLAHGGPSGEQLAKHKFDAVWILPHHWHMCRSYCAITATPNVHMAGMLWDPVFLKQTMASMRKNVFWREPENGQYTLGCFDPNLNVLKTFHWPLLVAEEAYRQDKTRISKMLLFSTLRLKESRHVTEMILATDLGRDGRISMEDRHPLVHVMGNSVHAVVTHQWENRLNYLYYELLYLGWPLIHNTPDLEGAGYYYQQFDPQDGGRVLNEALQGHPVNRITQRAAIRDVLWAVSVDNPANQDSYTTLVQQVMG